MLPPFLPHLQASAVKGEDDEKLNKNEKIKSGGIIMNDLRLKLLKREIKEIQEGRIEFHKLGFQNRELLQETVKQITDVSGNGNKIIFKIGTSELIFGGSKMLPLKTVDADVFKFCRYIVDFVNSFFSDLNIGKINSIIEKLKNDGYSIKQDWHELRIKNNVAEVEVNLFDTMLLCTEYTLGDTTYLAGEVVKGKPDETFNKKLDWLFDEIEDIAYVTQVNEML